MEELIAHFQANSMGYGIGAACAAPIVFVTRKYSVPLILYILEFCIYATTMHVVFWLLVVVTKWFKEQSSMRALREDGKPEDAPEWATPLIEFWKRELYNPDWIWIVEVVLLVVILGLMYRYRPMKIQRKAKRATQEFGKSSARAGAAQTKPGVKPKPGFFGASKGKRGR